MVLKHLPISSTAPSPNGILLVFSARGVLLADENSGASVVEWFGSIGRSMQTLFTIQTLAGWDSTTKKWRAGCAGCLKELFHGGYPLVNVYIANWKIIIFNGKFNYKWPCSIAMLVYRRVNMLGIAMCGSSQL